MGPVLTLENPFDAVLGLQDEKQLAALAPAAVDCSLSPEHEGVGGDDFDVENGLWETWL